jgi:catechol 2,3-dioxygenase-like lactoylglutathione lyase family enzyme
MFTLDHIQISIPIGRVDEALTFYTQVLGFTRVPKPAELQSANSGAWLTRESINLHLGEEPNFVTDGRGHPAFRVASVETIEQLAQQHGARVRKETGPNGFVRSSVFDPFGNRIELVQKLD